VAGAFAGFTEYRRQLDQRRASLAAAAAEPLVAELVAYGQRSKRVHSWSVLAVSTYPLSAGTGSGVLQTAHRTGERGHYAQCREDKRRRW